MAKLHNAGLFLVLLLAVPSDARAAEEIAIAAIGPLTGGSAPMGVSMLNGIRLAVAEINDSGGILGRKIVLEERDDQARNEFGARIAKELTQDHPVVAAIGIVNTGVALAVLPYFEEACIPLIVSVSTGSVITKQFAPPEAAENYIFRTSASTSLEVVEIANAVIRLKASHVAIFTDATRYGQVGRDDLMAALAERGLKPVDTEKFNIGDTSMIEQLQRARAAQGDILLTYGIGPELAHIALDRTAMKWSVLIAGSWTLSMSNYLDAAGSAAEGSVMSQTFIQDGDTPRRERFIAAYLATFGGGRIPSPPSAAQSYDAMYLLATAISQAGTTDGAKIRAALEDLRKPVEGVLKTYDHPFSAKNHEAIVARDLIPAVVKDGRVVRISAASGPAERK